MYDLIRESWDWETVTFPLEYGKFRVISMHSYHSGIQNDLDKSFTKPNTVGLYIMIGMAGKVVGMCHEL